MAADHRPAAGGGPALSVGVRAATAADAHAIHAVHQASVRGLCAPDYTADQIEAWVGRAEPDRYARAMAGGERMWVAEAAAGILGFAGRRGGEIRALYVHPAAAGRGVGRRLLEAAEASAGAEGVTELRLDASLTAVPFYTRMGYTIVTRHMHRLEDGTEIAAVAMRKALT